MYLKQETEHKYIDIGLNQSCLIKYAYCPQRSEFFIYSTNYVNALCTQIKK